MRRLIAIAICLAAIAIMLKPVESLADDYWGARNSAVKRLTNPAVLAKIIEGDKDDMVKQLATDRLAEPRRNQSRWARQLAERYNLTQSFSSACSKIISF
jgi:hypothetical protein